MNKLNQLIIINLISLISLILYNNSCVKCQDTIPDEGIPGESVDNEFLGLSDEGAIIGENSEELVAQNDELLPESNEILDENKDNTVAENGDEYFDVNEEISVVDNENMDENMGENIPENDENIPENDENIPDNDENIPENDENIPENDENIPENDENIPENTPDSTTPLSPSNNIDLSSFPSDNQNNSLIGDPIPVDVDNLDSGFSENPSESLYTTDPRYGKCSYDELKAANVYFSEDEKHCDGYTCVEDKTQIFFEALDRDYPELWINGNSEKLNIIASLLGACACRCKMMKCEVQYMAQNASQQCAESTSEYCQLQNELFVQKCSDAADVYSLSVVSVGQGVRWKSQCPVACKLDGGNGLVIDEDLKTEEKSEDNEIAAGGENKEEKEKKEENKEDSIIESKEDTGNKEKEINENKEYTEKEYTENTEINEEVQNLGIINELPQSQTSAPLDNNPASAGITPGLTSKTNTNGHLNMITFFLSLIIPLFFLY